MMRTNAALAPNSTDSTDSLPSVSLRIGLRQPRTSGHAYGYNPSLCPNSQQPIPVHSDNMASKGEVVEGIHPLSHQSQSGQAPSASSSQPAAYSRATAELSSKHNKSDTSDDDLQIPFDPNLVCPKCGRQFRRGEIQKLRKHHADCKREIPLDDEGLQIPFDPNLVCPKCGRQFRRGEIQKLRKHHADCKREIPLDYEGLQIPFDPNLVCPKCGRQFRRGEIQKLRKHHDDCESEIPLEGTGSDDGLQVPFDPNLVCPKCGRQFRRGELQKLRKHHDSCQQ